jgi:hypothetical protein
MCTGPQARPPAPAAAAARRPPRPAAAAAPATGGPARGRAPRVHAAGGQAGAAPGKASKESRWPAPAGAPHVRARAAPQHGAARPRARAGWHGQPRAGAARVPGLPRARRPRPAPPPAGFVGRLGCSPAHAVSLCASASRPAARATRAARARAAAPLPTPPTRPCSPPPPPAPAWARGGRPHSLLSRLPLGAFVLHACPRPWRAPLAARLPARRGARHRCVPPYANPSLLLLGSAAVLWRGQLDSWPARRAPGARPARQPGAPGPGRPGQAGTTLEWRAV